MPERAQQSRCALNGFMRLQLLAAVGLAAGLMGWSMPVSVAKADTAKAPAAAPAAQPADPPSTTAARASDPRQQTLMRMERPLTFKVDGQRLEDVMTYLSKVTQADIEPIWTTDQQEGLDKDTPITINAVNRPALNVLESILSKAQSTGAISSNTWQLTADGTLQCGPREALNHYRRLQIYDINDLLFVIPNYPQVPQIDLSSVLQQSQGGGGGGQNPFTGANNQQQLTPQQQEEARKERIKAIIDIIESGVESDQWNDNGGDAGTVREFNGSLLINAPDYIHRQINGYNFWPSGYTSQNVHGRRVVSLNMDTGQGSKRAKAKMTRYEPSAPAQEK